MKSDYKENTLDKGIFGNGKVSYNRVGTSGRENTFSGCSYTTLQTNLFSQLSIKKTSLNVEDLRR